MQISLAHIFYDQHQMLPHHEFAWKQHPRNSVNYILIDDCSPSPMQPPRGGGDVEVYRILDDIPWNIAGARNLAYSVAQTDWVLCADIDHVITPEALQGILELNLKDENVVYHFGRKRADGYRGVTAIMNTLMSKQRYFEVGGHDEDFSGHYGREETFFMHCLDKANVRRIYCDNIVLDWHPRIGATQKLVRDKSINAVLFEEKLYALRAGTYRNGPLLRFDWKMCAK